MFKNYFSIGWRSMLRTKGYSLINVSGLAGGMSIAILIGLWVLDEISFNKSFKNYDRLGQVYHHIKFDTEIMTINDVPAPIAETLKDNYTEFEAVAISSFQNEHVITYGNEDFSRTGLFVDSQFTNMFSVEMLQGSDKSLAEPRSIIISRTFASSLFTDSPIGKVVKFDNSDLLTISGVFEDFPSNSDFTGVHMLLPMAYYYSINESNERKRSNWDDFAFQCFVLLKDEASFSQAEFKMKNLLFESSSAEVKALKPTGVLFPMKQWHLFASFKDGINVGGDIRYVWMFGTMGIFVLVLACINFINLSTARGEQRFKEVGVRKVMGSVRSQLVIRFLSESFLIVSLGYLLAILTAALLLPWFNELSGKDVVIPWTDTRFILASVMFVMIVSFLAGFYPALYLSSFSPVRVLKGVFKASRFSNAPRKIMVVFQFTTSTVLIIGTIAVFLQIQHAKERPVGFDRERIFHVAIRSEDLVKTNYNSLRHELMSTNVVDNMATSDYPITGLSSVDPSVSWEGKDPSHRPLIAMNSCSHDFPKTNGFQFIEGRDFSKEVISDTLSVIVNEKAAKMISKTNAIGKRITFGHGKEYEIIGVIKDQVRSTPFAEQLPQLYLIDYSKPGYLTVRLSPGADTHDALQKIESVIKKFDTKAQFDYKFLDDDYERVFKHEERIGKLASVLSVLAIFISCVGMFGLAAFAASQRIKEIGVRKVMGASVFDIWLMLSNDFVRLVMVAVVLSVPLAYYFTDQWLQQYEYRIGLSWKIFAFTGLLALLITLLTVSYQALKAALINPANSLRSE